MPLWHWAKQHVILRLYCNPRGRKTQQSHSYTHHLSPSNNTTCTIDSSSVWHCGFLSSVLFWHCSWKKAFQWPGEERNFPVNRGEVKQGTGSLYLKQQWRDTEREKEKKPGLTCYGRRRKTSENYFKNVKGALHKKISLGFTSKLWFLTYT